MSDEYSKYKLVPIRHTDKRIGRNEKCPCGSGEKFKKCCIHERSVNIMIQETNTATVTKQIKTTNLSNIAPMGTATLTETISEEVNA